jgi:siroheme synthase (precorrin-2 oxidase/ferrochelatase)
MRAERTCTIAGYELDYESIKHEGFAYNQVRRAILSDIEPYEDDVISHEESLKRYLESQEGSDEEVRALKSHILTFYLVAKVNHQLALG